MAYLAQPSGAAGACRGESMSIGFRPSRTRWEDLSPRASRSSMGRDRAAAAGLSIGHAGALPPFGGEDEVSESLAQSAGYGRGPAPRTRFDVDGRRAAAACCEPHPPPTAGQSPERRPVSAARRCGVWIDPDRPSLPEHRAHRTSHSHRLAGCMRVDKLPVDAGQAIVFSLPDHISERLDPSSRSVMYPRSSSIAGEAHRPRPRAVPRETELPTDTCSIHDPPVRPERRESPRRTPAAPSPSARAILPNQ